VAYCGAADDGAGFFQIQAAQHHQIVDTVQSAAVARITVERGQISAQRLQTELARIIPLEWTWDVQVLGNQSYAVPFPSKEELDRMVQISSVNTRDKDATFLIEEFVDDVEVVRLLNRVWVTVTKVPRVLRSFLQLWAVGSIVGATQRVDMVHLRATGQVRLQVAVLDEKKIPVFADVCVGHTVYRLFFKADEVVQHVAIDPKEDLQGNGDKDKNADGEDREMEEAEGNNLEAPSNQSAPSNSQHPHQNITHQNLAMMVGEVLDRTCYKLFEEVSAQVMLEPLDTPVLQDGTGDSTVASVVVLGQESDSLRDQVMGGGSSSPPPPPVTPVDPVVDQVATEGSTLPATPRTTPAEVSAGAAADQVTVGGSSSPTPPPVTPVDLVVDQVATGGPTPPATPRPPPPPVTPVDLVMDQVATGGSTPPEGPREVAVATAACHATGGGSTSPPPPPVASVDLVVDQVATGGSTPPTTPRPPPPPVTPVDLVMEQVATGGSTPPEGPREIATGGSTPAAPRATPEEFTAEVAVEAVTGGSTPPEAPRASLEEDTVCGGGSTSTLTSPQSPLPLPSVAGGSPSFASPGDLDAEGEYPLARVMAPSSPPAPLVVQVVEEPNLPRRCPRFAATADEHTLIKAERLTAKKNLELQGTSFTSFSDSKVAANLGRIGINLGVSSVAILKNLEVDRLVLQANQKRSKSTSQVTILDSDDERENILDTVLSHVCGDLKETCLDMESDHIQDLSPLRRKKKYNNAKKLNTGKLPRKPKTPSKIILK
jgi:hypothetical protein